MSDRWYREAVVYCLDVETFQDSNGDGIGDLPGLISRLDYLARLGVTCLWLNPIHPSPRRDGGYDVTDFYGVHPQIGTLGDFAEMVHQAKLRGLRVIIDLVVNHTSDQHPWFKSARSSPDSPYRDWYVWSDEEPPDRRQGMVFPGVQQETWSYDRTAKAWYYHRFYRFQPDLNTANEAVQREIESILGFWLALGVSGFRMDAAPFVIERTEPGRSDSPKDFDQLTRYRERLTWRAGDAIILAEANVENDELVKYFGDEGGTNNRLPMLFDFVLSVRTLLALARGQAEPIREALRTAPPIPHHAQWATFLRNHDEVDLSRLSKEEQAECFRAFGPKPEMQLYGRGIRRRLAPMLKNDQAMLRLAYSLQFTLPGTPVLRYGEEIGMGDDLSLDERDAIRTPMQWADAPQAGFTTAREPVLPVISRGAYGYRKVNAAAQRRDPDSLLRWFEQLIRVLRECGEIGTGVCTILPSADPAVLVHRMDEGEGSLVFVHNLGPKQVRVPVESDGTPVEVFSDGPYDGPLDLAALTVRPRGFRWLRLAPLGA
jgi:maltose alpha-D-glucosyltransferase/alpha-amylase